MGRFRSAERFKVKVLGIKRQSSRRTSRLLDDHFACQSPPVIEF